MKILVIGAHGDVGRKLLPLLAERGHTVHAMIRDPDQADDLEGPRIEAVVGDLEGDFEAALDGCDAVVFTAGSGGESGAHKTAMIDGLGAIRAVDAAAERGIGRFVLVSSMGAGNPDSSESLRAYLVAKAIADGYLRWSGVPYTILRPGRLTDDEPTGRIRAGEDLGEGSITRGDVAHTIALALDAANTVGKTFEIVNDGEPIETALEAL